MTSASIEDKILSYGYTTNVGDVTSVSATSPLGVTDGAGPNPVISWSTSAIAASTSDADGDYFLVHKGTAASGGAHKLAKANINLSGFNNDIGESANVVSSMVARDASANFAAGTITADVFSGTATQAQYADLAENYLADKPYDAGTVLVIGGSEEVTEVTKQNAPNLAGVVSTDPAYLMNSTLEGDNVVTVALRGRVPVKVTGAVRKGDVLIASNTPGHAEAAPFRGYHVSGPSMIGIAISEHLSNGTGVVEAQIK